MNHALSPKALARVSVIAVAFMAVSSNAPVNASASSASDDTLKLTIPATAELQLDQTITLSAQLHLPAGTAGQATFSADTSALPGNDLTITFNGGLPASFNSQSAPTDVPVAIAIKSRGDSHSFKSLAVQVTVQLAGLSASQGTAVTIDPIYEVDLTGGPAPEGWSSPMTLTMPKHDGGVTVRFVNLDQQTTHIIHGEGAIPHQDINSPLAPATPNGPGGVYEVHVDAGDPVMGYYRCHTHESEDMLRSISFNN